MRRTMAPVPDGYLEKCHIASEIRWSLLSQIGALGKGIGTNCSLVLGLLVEQAAHLVDNLFTRPLEVQREQGNLQLEIWGALHLQLEIWGALHQQSLHTLPYHSEHH